MENLHIMITNVEEFYKNKVSIYYGVYLGYDMNLENIKIASIYKTKQVSIPKCCHNILASINNKTTLNALRTGDVTTVTRVKESVQIRVFIYMNASINHRNTLNAVPTPDVLTDSVPLLISTTRVPLRLVY